MSEPYLTPRQIARREHLLFLPETTVRIEAIDLFDLVVALTASKSPNNYAVLSPNYPDEPWFTRETGTKDYCIGVAETRGEPGAVVACHGFVVWPEERWGETLKEGDSDDAPDTTANR